MPVNKYKTYYGFPDSWVNRRIEMHPNNECGKCGDTRAKVINSHEEECITCFTRTYIERCEYRLDPNRVEVILDAQICDQIPE